jgi:N-acetylneuraminate synthase
MREFRTKFNKVASAMLVHEKLLETIAQEKKYTFMSTGMSSLKIIEKAVKIFRKYQCPFELMHCHSAYPMPPEEANLKLIPFLRKKFRCKVGYSGHESAATYVSLPAVLMGATSIERHITLNRSSYGTDQAASLEPKGLNTLVRDIRILEKIMGDGKKIVWKSEIPNQKKLRQILV